MRKTTPGAEGAILSFIVMLVLALPGGVRAGGAFDLLRMDPTPRGGALGGRPAAMSYADLGGAVLTPAGFAGLTGRRVDISYSDHPLDLSAGFLAVGQPVLKGYGAVSLTWFSYGEFDRITTPGGPVEGSFSADDLLFTLGWGRGVGHGVQVGAAGKALRSTIDTFTSTALALDFGALWDTGFQQWVVAAGVSNLGAQASTYAGVSEELPTAVHAGFAKTLAHLPLQLSGTAQVEKGEDLFATFAGEFTVSPLLKLRAGYTSRASDFRVGGDDDSLAGLSAGVGLTTGRYRVDYAFHSQGALGQVHRLGLALEL